MCGNSGFGLRGSRRRELVSLYHEHSGRDVFPISGSATGRSLCTGCHYSPRWSLSAQRSNLLHGTKEYHSSNVDMSTSATEGKFYKPELWYASAWHYDNTDSANQQ